MMFEERTRQDVLVYILAVLDALVFFFFEAVSAITFANVALCGLGIHTAQCHV